MKRFWGYIKGYSGSPSVYTLNTLAMFLGYPNFTSYVELNKTHGASDEQAINLQKLNSDIVNIKIRLMEIEQHLGLNNKVGE